MQLQRQLRFTQHTSLCPLFTYQVTLSPTLACLVGGGGGGGGGGGDGGGGNNGPQGNHPEITTRDLPVSLSLFCAPMMQVPFCTPYHCKTVLRASSGLPGFYWLVCPETYEPVWSLQSARSSRIRQ